MRSLLAGLLAVSVVVVPAIAQEKSAAGEGVDLGGSTTATRSETCVEVEIGGEKSPTINCLNRELKDAVGRAQPTGNIPPVSASSPAVQVGGFDATAMSEQYGQNWGKSVVPYRPPAPVYANPLRP